MLTLTKMHQANFDDYIATAITTYAKEKDVSVQTVYKWIEKGELQCVSIDNVKFVKV